MEDDTFFFERGYFFLFATFVALVGFFGLLIASGLMVEEYFSGMSKCALLSEKETETCTQLIYQNIWSYMLHAFFVLAEVTCGLSLMGMSADSNVFYKISKDLNKAYSDFNYETLTFFSFLFLISGIFFFFFGYMDGKALRLYTVDMALTSSVIVIFSTIFVLYQKKKVELREKEEIKE